MATRCSAALPTRDGVGPSCVSLPAGRWSSLLEFLCERFAHIAPQVWAQRLAAGQVLDEQGHPLSGDAPYRAHSRVYYYRALPAEPPVPFQETLLFQDEHLLVVDKPHFLPVTPGGRFVQQSLLVRLKRRTGIDDLQPIHRLDRETAGLVLFCLQPQARDAYPRLFRQHQVHKEYRAVAPWRTELQAQLPLTRESRIEPGKPFMRMHEVPGPANARTSIDVIALRGTQALYRLVPHTGKKHQLRVHMAALGIPIRNDPVYPELQAAVEPDFDRPMQLLARTIAFTDPVTGQAREFVSTLRLQWE